MSAVHRTDPVYQGSDGPFAELERLKVRNAELERLLNRPEVADFLQGVELEAAHQVDRWGEAHDRGKAPEDWFWLVGYLAGKALHAAKAGDREKALHHTISTGAALANWHVALLHGRSSMRPGIDPVATGLEPDPDAERRRAFQEAINA